MAKAIMAPRMRDAGELDVDALRAVQVRSTPETSSMPFVYRPGMPTDARSLALLQRSAGNAAVRTFIQSRRRPIAPMVHVQRRAAPEPAPAPPTNATTTEQKVGGGGPVDESIMVGAGGGGGPAKQAGGGAGRAGGAGAVLKSASGEKAGIVADAKATTAKLGSELKSAQGRVGAQVNAAKAHAQSALNQATASSQSFFATKNAEIQGAANLAEQNAMTQATAMTAAAQGQAAATHAQLQAATASISAGLSGRVSGFADQIVGAITGISLPDLPGVSQIRAAVAGMVRRAASGVTSGIGAVRQLLAGVLQSGLSAVTSMIGRAGTVVMGVVRQIGSAIRSAAAAVTRALMTIAGKVSQLLGGFLRGTVFPALDRMRSAVTGHLTAGYKKAVAAIKANIDYHLSMLEKVAKLAPGGAGHGGPAGAGAGDDAAATFVSIAKSARENNQSVVGGFVGRIGHILSSVAEMAIGAARQVGQRISGVVNQVISTVVGKVAEAVQVVRQVAGAIAGFLGSILGSLRSAFTSAIDWVKKTAAHPADELVSFGSNALNAASSFLGRVVSNIFSGNFSLPGLGLGAFRPGATAGGPVEASSLQGSFSSSSTSVLGIIGMVAAVVAGIVLLPLLLAGVVGLALVALAALVVFGPLFALIALVLYGLYKLGKWIFTPSKLAVTHETAMSAPGGAPKTRTEVGVGEKVKFESNKKGKWTASDGSPKSGPVGSAFSWTAPDRAGSSAISIEVAGAGAEKVEFGIVEPSGITAKKESEVSLPKGQQGAGMILDFTYGPASVSFGRVSAREVAGGPSNVKGYYAEDGDAHFHKPASQEFFQLGENNRPVGGVKDRATQFGSTPPWKFGSFVWNIPNRFQVAGEDGDGKVFAKTEQEFVLADETGTTTITKAGASVTRKP